MSVQTTIENGVAEILLDHPPVNAFDSTGWIRLAAEITRVGVSDDANVILIHAKGRGFCAGVDIKELAKDSSVITAVNHGCYETFAAIYDCPIPVISAAHGFVLGGGIGIVGASDIIIASDDATFGLPEIDRGALGAATHLLSDVPDPEGPPHALHRRADHRARGVPARSARVGRRRRPSCCRRRARSRARSPPRAPRRCVSPRSRSTASSSSTSNTATASSRASPSSSTRRPTHRKRATRSSRSGTRNSRSDGYPWI